MPEPELPEANNTGDGEIVLPSNDTEVNTPETGNETLPEQPIPELPTTPVTNETEPVHRLKYRSVRQYVEPRMIQQQHQRSR